MKISVTTDLRHLLDVVRDQGPRPTCLVFAATGAHEARRGQSEYLSVESLFWAAAQRSHKDPTRGTTTDFVSAALVEEGQCYEIKWPYLPTTPLTTSWTPPPGAGVALRATLDFIPRNVTEIRKVLQDGQPVVLVMAVTQALYEPDSDAIVRPKKTDTVTSQYHALLAVGVGCFKDDEYILVRNSWGIEWGDAGHAWLPDAYVATHLHTTGLVTTLKAEGK